MLSNGQIKRIKSLQQKKFRKEHHLFPVEGEKMILELIKSKYKTHVIYTTDHRSFEHTDVPVELVTPKELNRISTQKNANKAIALVNIPEKNQKEPNIKNKLSIVLEDIQDPGNMGTIIRLASWYGIQDIFCSPNTVDCYNPKVVQSTMGAIFRVNIHYSNIYELIRKHSEDPLFGIYCTHLQGNSMYKESFTPQGFIVMGNESSGLSKKFNQLPVKKIRIPAFPDDESEMESLNVAVATAIVCAEFRRQHNK